MEAPVANADERKRLTDVGRSAMHSGARKSAEIRRSSSPDALLDVRREVDGSWSVSVRAMPGHVGCGMTLEEAYVEAQDAALAWVEAATSPHHDALLEALIEWVDAEAAYWDYVKQLPLPDGQEPDFGPFNRWKAAQSNAHALRAALPTKETE
jgi:predicted RNase H-like HicB family nuclease